MADNQSGSSRVFAVVLLVGAPLLVMLLFLLDLFLTARATANMARSSDFVFTEAGVESVGEFGRSFLSWKGYLKVRESKKDFMLFSDQSIFTPIPKRYFRNDDEIATFRELVSRHHELT